MNPIIPRRFRALVFLAIAFAGARTQARPIVWVVPALTRVGPEEAARGARQIELWAGRGEYESFQVIVRGAPARLAEAAILTSGLTNVAGHDISRENIRVYREQYVHIARASPDRGGTNRPLGPGWYPDALIPINDRSDDSAGVPPERNKFFPGSTPLGGAGLKNQPFWVDVFVPRTAAPGEYHGTVTIADQTGAASIPVKLHVWNFELPMRPSLHSAFWIFNDAADNPPVLYADRAENQQLLLEHKIMPLSADPANEREFIDRYGLNISLLKWFDTASYGHCDQPAAPPVAELLALKAKHQPDLPLYVYMGDEVTTCTNIFPLLRQWAANVRQADLLSMLTAVPLPELRGEVAGRGGPAADIWVLLPKQFVSNAADVAAARAQGGQTWVYTAVVQDSYSPKWAIDFSPVNYRLLGGFLSQSQGASGLLYWAVNSWAIHGVPDHWNDLVYKENAPGIPPGEGWLVYPGEHGGFVPSMRLKWIRKSVEDYEYVEMLKKAGRGDWAMQIVKAVAGDWAHWSQDAEAIDRARRELGAELDRIGSRPVSSRNTRPMESHK
ncbi:MAG: DUF4091 domain-containing protein [Acidobacteriia bacterium]|nr:DUF4091 domain-containing protein [Terriglobia bacterium]